MKTLRQRPGGRGFTLIELLIAVAVVAIIIVIAAPSFRDMVLMQRLRSITAQLVTDLQFARNEAVSRGTLVRVFFRSDASATCYTVFTSPTNATRCDCLLGSGNACNGDMREIRTVQVPATQSVRVIPPAGQNLAFAFDPVTGGLFSIPTDRASVPMAAFAVETFIDNQRKLQTQMNRSGRPLVCRPVGSTMSEVLCVGP